MMKPTLSTEMLFDEFREAINHGFVPLETGTDDESGFRAVMRDGCRLGPITITEVSATAHTVRRTPRAIRTDTGDFFKVGLQTHGYSVLEQDGREALLAPSDFAIYDTTRPYQLSFDDRFRSLVVMFPRSLLQVTPNAISRLTARRIPGDRGIGALLTQYVQSISALPQHPVPAVSQHLHDGVLDLLSAALTEQLGDLAPPAETRLHTERLRITSFIEARLSDPALDTPMVAAAHHVSVRHLQKIFQSDGISVASWIRARRLERCRRDLLDPEFAHLPVAAIGARWGLRDAAHFSRAFKAVHGDTPGSYRARSRS